MKSLVVFLSITAIAHLTPIMAQSEEQAMAYQAYLSTNKSLWKQLVNNCTKEFGSDPSHENLYQLTLAQHGLLNATMADQDEDLFDEHYKKTKKNLEKLIDADHEAGNAKALLSSIYGMEMAYSSWKGMFLGSKSSSNLDQAKKIAPSSPLVWQVYGGSKLFTPAMFGGDKEEAVTSFEKSVRLYEADPDLMKSNWRYLDALAWLGQSYHKTGKTEKAKQTFEKALEIEPGFGWVKFVLLPAINKTQP